MILSLNLILIKIQREILIKIEKITIKIIIIIKVIIKIMVDIIKIMAEFK
jgi:hypothetical protein